VKAPPISCAVCERTLLDGEHPVRFSPDGRDLVDVCPLCKERALELGWYPEGGPSLPVVAAEKRRQRRGLSVLLGRRETAEPVLAAEPILRRLSEPEQAIVEAAELFNASAFQRNVEGIARSGLRIHCLTIRPGDFLTDREGSKSSSNDDPGCNGRHHHFYEGESPLTQRLGIHGLFHRVTYNSYLLHH